MRVLTNLFDDWLKFERGFKFNVQYLTGKPKDIRESD